DLGRPQPAEFRAREPDDVPPGDVDRARTHSAVAREVPNGRQRGRRLAAARLADETVRLARSDPERDAPQNLPIAPPDAVDDIEVVQFERRRGGLGRHRSNAREIPSAIRFTPMTSDATAAPGKRTVQ